MPESDGLAGLFFVLRGLNQEKLKINKVQDNAPLNED
jgi:hypothetical protein